MCGRVTVRTPPKALAEALGFVFGGGLPAQARFNVAPGAALPAVVDAQPDQLIPLRWGLIPRWAEDEKIAHSLANARSESVQSKPAFREAFRLRRCVVWVDGFYEWLREGKRKRPFFFTRADGQPLALAGLWDEWVPSGGEPVRTCTLLTCAANETMAPIHDRMPVILERSECGRWLGRSETPEIPPAAAAGVLTLREVSARVNDARHDADDCLSPPEREPQLQLF